MDNNDDEAAVHSRKTTILKRVDINCFIFVCILAGFVVGVVCFIKLSYREDPVPKIKLANMELTSLNITETRLSAEWGLSIRIPYSSPGYYVCLQGNLQASFLYKNVTLATSSKLGNLLYIYSFYSYLSEEKERKH